MKKFFLTLLLAVQLNPIEMAFASSEICNREIFSHEELNNPYISIKKPLQKNSRLESERISKAIERNAKEASNRINRPCMPNTKSCSGQDESWTYHRELILDNFGNLLRFNGEISSKQLSNWPAGKYYAHQTQVGYSCSWGGNLQAQCQKWCSLVVVDDRFHD